MKTLSEQIAAAERELAVRKNIYPKWVQNNRMDAEKAAHETECMAAIIETLKSTLQPCEWHIWCFERSAWWKPNCNGYSKHISDAGHYSFKEAFQIIAYANNHGRIEEAMIPYLPHCDSMATELLSPTEPKD